MPDMQIGEVLGRYSEFSASSVMADFNPTENCWTTLKEKVSANLPSSHADLCEKIKQVWVNEITVGIKAVLKNKGHPTKY